MKNILVIFFLASPLISLNAQSPYYYGEFKLRKIISFYDTSGSLVNYHATSILYTDTVNENYSPLASNQGTVFFNGTSLQYNSTIKLYFDTLQRTENNSQSWRLDGSGGMVSFTTTSQDTFPALSNYSLIPDTIVKSDSLYLQFENVIYADEIEVLFWDGIPRVETPFNRKISGNTTHISIPTSNLGMLDGETVYVTVSLVKKEYEILDGSRFKFEKRFDIVKTAVLLE